MADRGGLIEQRALGYEQLSDSVDFEFGLDQRSVERVDVVATGRLTRAAPSSQQANSDWGGRHPSRVGPRNR